MCGGGGGHCFLANSEKEGIIDSNEEAYSIHHEEFKSICFVRCKIMGCV